MSYNTAERTLYGALAEEIGSFAASRSNGKATPDQKFSQLSSTPRAAIIDATDGTYVVAVNPKTTHEQLFLGMRQNGRKYHDLIEGEWSTIVNSHTEKNKLAGRPDPEVLLVSDANTFWHRDRLENNNPQTLFVYRAQLQEAA